MGDAGPDAIRRLNKREAERLLGDYDADPVAALSTALRILLDMGDAAWPALVAAAPIDATRRNLLVDADQATLDGLARELNELRGFDPSPT